MADNDCGLFLLRLNQDWCLFFSFYHGWRFIFHGKYWNFLLVLLNWFILLYFLLLYNLLVDMFFPHFFHLLINLTLLTLPVLQLWIGLLWLSLQDNRLQSRHIFILDNSNFLQKLDSLISLATNSINFLLPHYTFKSPNLALTTKHNNFPNSNRVNNFPLHLLVDQIVHTAVLRLKNTSFVYVFNTNSFHHTFMIHLEHQFIA